MVMNPDESAMDLIIRHNMEPEIYSMESYESFLRSARRHGLVSCPVHLKMDTGMHRLGFSASETDRLAEMLRSEQHVRVISLFSHCQPVIIRCMMSFTHRQASLLTRAAAKTD
ncbi:MAG: alanine racemase [Marinilabiliales bacterium]|nr:alanine racemase [Marinilabiliales bacterium]